MKPKATVTPLPATLLDGFFLLIAGAALEAQTHGAVRPFGVQRRTLKTLAVRAARRAVRLHA